MPNFFDTIGKVEPCDGRDLLQKLTYVLITKVAEGKSKACEELSTVFTNFGLENFSPCDTIDTRYLQLLTAGDKTQAVNALLLSQGLPPYTVEIILNGYSSLDSAQKKQVEAFLKGVVLGYSQREIEPLIRAKIAELVKCPSEAQTILLLTRLENITRTVSNLQVPLNELDKYVSISSATVSALNDVIVEAKKIITALEISIPIQAALPVGTAGLTAWVVTRAKDFVKNNADDIQRLDDNLCQAAKGIRYANSQLLIIQSFLEIADTLLRSCTIESDFASRITPRSYSPRTEATGYRGYILEIREDQNTLGIAPRRYAVALDSNGIVVLEGQKSYSSSTDILIQELKFRIDNRLG